jgi:hypothetical protein
VSGRVDLERGLLIWAANYPDTAAQVFEALAPEAFCAPGHRRIAAALAAQVQAGEFRPDALGEEVPEDDAAREALAEVLLAEADPPGEEVLAGAIQKLLTLVACGVDSTPSEHPPETLAEIEAPAPGAVALDKLRAELAERLDRGEMTADDPLYQEYLRLVEALHGRHGTPYYEGRRTAWSRHRGQEDRPPGRRPPGG